MAGHNKWSKVKHRKAVVDKRKGKALSMCSRAIISAVRQHGTDPTFNHALRAAIDEARYHNVPGDNIERAIKKGAGSGQGDDYEHVRYEGYGPAGVAVVVDALTDNRTRTAANIRLVFDTHSGKMGTSGCVSHQFEHKGRIEVKGVASDEDRILEAAMNAGADDAKFNDEAGEDAAWDVFCPPTELHTVKAALEASKLVVRQTTTEMLPSQIVTVHAAVAREVIDLIDELEDDEDVKRVYSNADIPESELAKLGG